MFDNLFPFLRQQRPKREVPKIEIYRGLHNEVRREGDRAISRGLREEDPRVTHIRLLAQNIAHCIFPQYILTRTKNGNDLETETLFIPHNDLHKRLAFLFEQKNDPDAPEETRKAATREYASLSADVKKMPLYRKCVSDLMSFGMTFDIAPHNFIIEPEEARITYIDKPESPKASRLLQIEQRIAEIEDAPRRKEAEALFKQMGREIEDLKKTKT